MDSGRAAKQRVKEESPDSGNSAAKPSARPQQDNNRTGSASSARQKERDWESDDDSDKGGAGDASDKGGGKGIELTAKQARYLLESVDAMGETIETNIKLSRQYIATLESHAQFYEETADWLHKNLNK